MKYFYILTIVISILSISCNNQPPAINEADREKLKTSFYETLELHLKAVSNRDLSTLKSTMSPKGNMELILPGTEIISTVDSFLTFHEKWFQEANWTFETKILQTDIGHEIGTAIVESMYRELDRNGQPYFNRMHISYVLKRIDNRWYLVQDHASSVEKSTDKK